MDDLGNQHETWQSWFRDWPQMFVVITGDDSFIGGAMENFFKINLALIRNRECWNWEHERQREEGWKDIVSVEECVQLLKTKLEQAIELEGDEIGVFIDLNWLRIKMGLAMWGEGFEEPYFLEGGFRQDLENFIKLLHHIKSTGAHQIKLCVDGA
jgi:hypothetical protein